MGGIDSENELIDIIPLLKNLRTLTFSSFRGDLSKLLPELNNLTCLNLNYNYENRQYLLKNANELCSVYK
jgi:hypothetical protein